MAGDEVRKVLRLDPVDPFDVRGTRDRASFLVVLSATDDREGEPLIVGEQPQRLAESQAPLQRREAAEEHDPNAFARVLNRWVKPVARGADRNDDGTAARCRAHAFLVLGRVDAGK